MVRDGGPELAGRPAQYTRRGPAGGGAGQAGRDSARRRSGGREHRRRPAWRRTRRPAPARQPELLGHDRRTSASTTRSGRRGGPRDRRPRPWERAPRSGRRTWRWPARAGAPLEPETPCGIREQVADPDHRPSRSSGRDRPEHRAGSVVGAHRQPVAARTRAGSRSSRVVVVTKACGEPAICRTRCAADPGRAREGDRRGAGAAAGRPGRSGGPAPRA